MTFAWLPQDGITPHQQFYDATAMIGLAGDAPRFFGSGFFVANLSWMQPYLHEAAVLFFVTAAHVVRPFLHEGRSLCVRLQRFGDSAIDRALPPDDSWVYSEEGADVAIVPLPDLKCRAQRGGIRVAAISHQQLFIEDWELARFDFRFGDPVRIMGLWYGSTALPQLILRSGAIATSTVGPVQTDAGQVPMYLVDATVTRAMSGGPAFVTKGAGAEQNAVIGVNHGYWPLHADELREPDETVQGDGSQETVEERERRRLLRSVERLNSRLAIITPIHHVGRLLTNHALWSSHG